MTNIELLTEMIEERPPSSDLRGRFGSQLKQLEELGLVNNSYSKFIGRQIWISRAGGRMWNRAYRPDWEFAFTFQSTLETVYLYSVRTAELLKAVEIAQHLRPKVVIKLRRARHRFFFWSKSVRAHVATFTSPDIEALDAFDIRDALGLSQVYEQMWNLFLRRDKGSVSNAQAPKPSGDAL